MIGFEACAVFLRIIAGLFFFPYPQTTRCEWDKWKAAWERCNIFKRRLIRDITHPSEIVRIKRNSVHPVRIFPGTFHKVNGHPEILKSTVRLNTRRHEEKGLVRIHWMPPFPTQRGWFELDTGEKITPEDSEKKSAFKSYELACSILDWKCCERMNTDAVSYKSFIHNNQPSAACRTGPAEPFIIIIIIRTCY